MSRHSSESPGCSGLIGGILIFLYLCYIFTSYVWSISSSATINCKKIKHEYVHCYLKRNYLFGLWNNSIPELRLLGTDVETIDSEGAEFRSLYLKTDKGRIKFHQYGFNENTDAKEINIFLHDSSKSSMQISRAWNPFLDPLCIILSPLLFLGFLIALYSACSLSIKYLRNQIIRLR